jgi:hypothetical protein
MDEGEYAYEKVRKWTKKVDIFSAAKVRHAPVRLSIFLSELAFVPCTVHTCKLAGSFLPDVFVFML